MKIKVDDKVFDGAEQPIMVILEPQDKENIKDMLPHARKYCMFPDNYSKEEIKDWMKMDDDKEYKTLYFDDSKNPKVVSIEI